MAAPVTTLPPYYMGYWYDVALSQWESRTCNYVTYTYTSSGAYAGCWPLYTGCTTTDVSATETNPSLNTCSDNVCVTQTIYDGAPPLASGGKLNIFCATVGYSYLTLFRELPASTTSSSEESSSATATASLSLSTPTRPSTLTRPSISTRGPSTPTRISPSLSSPTAGESQLSDSSSPVSAGVIAGATIGGVALLLLAAFLVWFFGFHRKKNSEPGKHGTQGGATPEYVTSTVSHLPEWVPPSSIPSVGHAQYPNTR